MTGQGPLTGVRVLDVSTILAGPLCCQILGDFGAEVIKVEHPKTGDGMRGHGLTKSGVSLWWKEISRNKRTLALDLSDAEGAAILRTLAGVSDVLVENFRPGTLERWGLDPQSLCADNPRLVVVRVTGFGQHGPYAERRGFGTLAEAMSGFAHLTGDPDGPPTLPAFGLADSICGIAASSAVAMALYHRERNGGVGQIVDINLLEPMMTAAGPSPTVYDQLGIVQMRSGNKSLNNAPRNTYLTADDRWVAISTSAQAVAERVMERVGHPEVISEPWFSSGAGRVAHGETLDQYVADWIRARTRDVVIREMNEAGAAVAPVYDASDILQDEHIRQTEMIARVPDDDLGDVAMHNVMWRMSESPGSIRFTGRGVGQDSDAILTELTHASEADLAALRERGVVA